MSSDDYIAPSQPSNNDKYDIARENNIPLKEGYNGDLTAEQAGKIGGEMGGEIGGNKVKDLVRQAEQNLKQ
ncbi:small, acid-soluble spore protein, alpha/beta type [Tuberibacillus sp. Marseille-P3662]|uniref:small, acid-soluble spore protein, alpha/beta type n=1 Tax=Tuberibacillus sp. Marseille-P3662 TaxID=1965358 RepID=UPI0020CB5E41|nr:small, acid-soluble spore protein, alpha/beta type [Tuberibacillus sp. Marseille-P3662]